MKKPSVIIFSSAQGLNIAEAVQTELGFLGVAELWNQGMFEPGSYTMDSIINSLATKDFAIIVMTTDDLTMIDKAIDKVDINDIKRTAIPAPRDNVVFELGLSIGILGRERTFVVRDRNPLLRLPTDLAGYNILDFDYPHHVSPRVALGYACNQIKEVITKFGLKLQMPTAPTLSKIPNEYLRSFGISIVGSTMAAVESLIHNEAARMPETQYLEYLIGEVKNLAQEDFLLAICGGKNYDLTEVYQYLNENVELARRSVRVYRLYVAPAGEFSDREWEVIDAHLAWADKLPSFKVGVLVGESDCAKLLELNLPHRFGMVLTRHSGLWKSRIHYGLDDGKQGGWEFRQEAIILKQRQFFDELALKAKQVGVSSTIRNAMNKALDRLGDQKEKRLWRFGQDRPV